MDLVHHGRYKILYRKCVHKWCTANFWFLLFGLSLHGNLLKHKHPDPLISLEGQQMCMDTTEGVFNNNNKCVWIRQRDFSITSDYLPLVPLELQHTAYNLYCTRCHIQVLEYIWNTLYIQLISNTSRLSLPTYQGFFN